ncbi:hypothetical protein CPB83DRAFT_846349 [Crepidotus variabilis]|uniref:Uncharacterized protein n=1 Tax=Crepidotus variabilis TaxID=179855 RepID=A0A9P6EQ00_9AGAR|nr:hypothetical protein CPB83DRAFT_846349 [Crepidotus variabilis]
MAAYRGSKPAGQDSNVSGIEALNRLRLLVPNLTKELRIAHKVAWSFISCAHFYCSLLMVLFVESSGFCEVSVDSTTAWQS